MTPADDNSLSGPIPEDLSSLSLLVFLRLRKFLYFLFRPSLQLSILLQQNDYALPPRCWTVIVLVYSQYARTRYNKYRQQ